MVERDEDNGVPWLLSRVRDHEYELFGLTMDLETNASLCALREHPAWRTAMGRFQPTLDAARSNIMTQRMDEYELGRRQGLIWGLSMLLRNDVLSEDEIQQKRQRIDQLREVLAEERAVLR